MDDAFDGRPAWQRDVYDAIVGHLRSLGQVHEDAVAVGVFLKADQKVLEVRPGARTVVLFVALPRPVDHPRLRVIAGSHSSRVWHRLPLRSAEDLDGEVLDWLTEAYDLATHGGDTPV